MTLYAEEIEWIGDEVRILVGHQWVYPNKLTMSKDGIWATVNDGFSEAFVKYDPEMAQKKRDEIKKMMETKPF